ncbi:MAG: hypothetical protein GWN01_00405 [Nitrosopumilaceae archaeon]|nr:hypothetical protein [Nitrosopumilaceae archaeon]NIT99444.1 hypothetical protein [Nitrosopumilaceae archaeon]NIU85803.1 hypothetical protein [Nitrosopumilaceae archaeon]NIV64660.1 hypothetical protein [Nitrosopumilaceae archaeon]NIX60047.1 hypothetical protein [Nitrosopumilaceae archaeon]
MPELEEFAEALLDQLSVEFNEEKEIQELSTKIKEDSSFKVEFESLEDISERLFPKVKEKIKDFWGITLSDVKLSYPELEGFKKLKANKVFATEPSRQYVDELFEAVSKQDKDAIIELIKKDSVRYLVYSTYAKAYISKITTTYGDYLDSVIYLNKFVLSNYPQIILYKQGQPYESRANLVRSGYHGALKMTIIEEQIHSLQDRLHQKNKSAVIEVNAINEELAKIILELDNETVKNLSDYLQLQPVPDDFPLAKRANLFFMLNPDNFIVNVLGPDVMTYTKVEIDPKISQMVPQLADIYQRWLKPIQAHHAAFTTMEGLAEFSVQNILKDDEDFQNYLTTFEGMDISSYQVRKNMGMDFVKVVFKRLGNETFERLLEYPPSTKELKDPSTYLDKLE